MHRLIAVGSLLGVLTIPAHARPLKVYILAGQSNMQGQARVETFDYIGHDPATAPMLKEMRGPDGKPRVCENVYIQYFSESGYRGAGGPCDKKGRLTAGFGGVPVGEALAIGPELTFGITMQKALNEPMLIIKTAWGGKSLSRDFRPPSAGPYALRPEQVETFTKQGRLEEVKAQIEEGTGKYYRLMVSHVKEALGDIKAVYPDYDPSQGYELAGFVWFQGWNDMCDSWTYPDRNKPGGYAEYSNLMAHFIRDVRKELSAPEMPFVIGVIGVGGHKVEGAIAHLRPAMAAPADMPEFKGNVAAVQTADFWDDKMEELMPKKGKADHRLRAAHVIAEDGVMEKRDTDMPGWEPIGTPQPEDRIWRFISFDPQGEKNQMKREEKKRFRDVSLPEGLEKWYMPDFDDSSWQSGKAPIGKGVWKHRAWPEVKCHADWGDGEFLLMRTTFEVEDLDHEAFRISILARQGFHVYLNGHKIHTYIWWKDEPYYRPIELESEHAKHLKKGVNVLAAYANVNYDRKTKEPHAVIDLDIEGISKAGLEYVKSEAYVMGQMTKVCTPEEATIIRGASNGGYHYLGSAKMMGQIGKAFAEAMSGMAKELAD